MAQHPVFSVSPSSPENLAIAAASDEAGTPELHCCDRVLPRKRFDPRQAGQTGRW